MPLGAPDDCRETSAYKSGSFFASVANLTTTTPTLHDSVCPGLQARPECGILAFSLNGGVLVSTEGLRTGLHAEDDSLAS